MFALLDDGRCLADADQAYWTEFLAARRRLIGAVIERVDRSAIEPRQRARMVAALKASIGRGYLITPELCAVYLEAWQADCVRWHKHIRELRRDHGDGQGIEDALATLRIDHIVQSAADGRIRARVVPRSAATRSAVRAWLARGP